MRAVSVKVNEVVGVAGFVVPGTRVDVMVTLTNRQRSRRALTPRGREQRPGAHRGHPHTTRRTPRTANRFRRPVVTLLVSPEDGERIALAASEGHIMLTLRNPLDTALTTTSGTRTTPLFGQPAVGRRRRRLRPVRALEAGST